MTKRLLDYYQGDDFVAGVWLNKYATKDEVTPDDMHRRMAKELARYEFKHLQEEKLLDIVELSTFGREHIKELSVLSEEEVEDYIFGYLKDYKWIIPQGSIMTMLGNRYKIGSLSNCFVIPSPADSYGGILKMDQQLVQLMKRRGGVGGNLNTLRPSNTPVSNAAGTSTGAVSFMHRFSNSTREVAQNGRRGALMLLLSCLHPEIFDFVKIKSDLTKVTGANVSTMLTDKFMEAVETDGDFYCRFPIDIPLYKGQMEEVVKEYNKIYHFNSGAQVMKIHAKELFDLIIEMAWANGEPGLAFIDAVHNWSPEGVYEAFKAIACNPCGEQWMQAYDACRLLCINLFSVVKNPYTPEAELDYDKLYEIAYLQQRLADVIVDLEIEYVGKIIAKIQSDPEPEDVKRTELELWENVRKTATASRRTGCGFTGMADMLAALGVKYDSDKAMAIIQRVMHRKMEAELDCTIDMAVTRGAFEGWSADKEFLLDTEENIFDGKNNFYEMLTVEFQHQVEKMMQWGRRNVSWSTVAPTGTVSLVAKLIKYANMGAGVEPIFAVYHFRNKKVNANEEGVRVDFVDQNGDSWQTYPVVMAGLREWYDISGIGNGKAIEDLTKDEMDTIYRCSPYYGSCANDIDWEKRVDIQALVQRYTTNAISSTINLPNDVKKEVVGNIYMKAWKAGLKGVTVYRDGCRTGVMVTENTKKDSFEYRDATKRPKDLIADLHAVTVKGNKYGVVVGLVDDKPYEIFAFNLPAEVKGGCNGKIIKVKKGHYDFQCDDVRIKDIQQIAVHKDEQVLTRLVSGMLRHGAKPQFVMEQIDKCELEIVSFGKAISRVLKKYVKDEDLVNRNTCKSCGSTNLRMQEGCLTCNDCGSSKCG
jgi:ribonucleoside-diphosphate reductase alpha chain